MSNLTVAGLKEIIEKFEKDFKANSIDTSEVPVKLVSNVKDVASDQETLSLLIKRVLMLKFFSKSKPKNTSPQKTENTKLCLSANEILSMAHTVKSHCVDCKSRSSIQSFAIDQKSESGIGLATTLRCSCGKEFDITDYSCW